MKVLITIPDDLLKAIDAACQEEIRSRSQFIQNVVKSYLNKTSLKEIISQSPIPPKLTSRCDIPFCKGIAQGKYLVSAIDSIDGSVESEHFLCPFHLHKAKLESEVVELN